MGRSAVGRCRCRRSRRRCLANPQGCREADYRRHQLPEDLASFGALQTAYQRVPLLTHGLVALGVLLAIAFAANDSGTSIPPAAGLLAVPLLIAITARASGDEVPDPTAPRPGRR